MSNKKIKKPTLKQKLAFEKMLEAMKTGNDVNLKAIMKKAGYTDITSCNPSNNLLNKEGFQMLLNKIDDNVILNKFYEILQAEDKRASIQAGKELLLLKDRYPASKSKIIGLFDRISSLEEDEE
jgi:hypothetical protein